MRALTLILPFYKNRGMLREQQRVWRDYSPEVRAQLHVIVVDDVSPPDQRALEAVEETGIGSFSLYRNVDTKRRWNWLFARNLGVAQAKTDWVLMTDIDHLIPPSTMMALLTMPLDERNIYRLARVDAPRPWPYAISDCPVREKKRFHPNTWLMTRTMYDRVGGYDERLSGCYGTDGEFRDRVNANARAVVCLPDVMVRYAREVIEDASTLPDEFTRKNDPANDEELRRRRAKREAVAGWKPLRVTFKWVHELTVTPQPSEVAC